MAKLQSIFGEFANGDAISEMYNYAVEAGAIYQPWHASLFPYSPPQISLSYVALLAGVRNVPAASIVDRDGETPLRSREALKKLQGQIPKIAVMRDLNEEQLRDYEVFRRINNGTAEFQSYVLDLIWGDVSYVIEAIDKRLEYIVAEGLSKGEVTLTTDNNPDGIITTSAMKVKLPVGNKRKVIKAWTSKADADFFQDVRDAVDDAKKKGITFGKILMDGTLIATVLATAKVKAALVDFGGGIPHGLQLLNQYLQAAGLPIVEEVDFITPIEKNGVIGTQNPWASANAVLVPNGNLGSIKNAIAIEELHEADNVGTYAKLGRKLISKWSINEPYREWTKGELNAIPSFDAIERVYILTSDDAKS